MAETEWVLAALSGAAVFGVAFVVARRHRAALEPKAATRDEVLESIQRIMDSPPDADRERQAAEEPWLRVDVGDALTGASPAGSYRVDPDGLGVLVSLPVVEMIWGDSEDIPPMSSVNLEVILHALSDSDATTVEGSPSLAAAEYGESLHLEDVTLHRANGTVFQAELWSYPDIRDDVFHGAEVFILDHSRPTVATFLVTCEGLCRTGSVSGQALLYGRLDNSLVLNGVDLRHHLASAALWDAVSGGAEFHEMDTEVRPFRGSGFRAEIESRPVTVDDLLLGAALTVRPFAAGSP